MLRASAGTLVEDGADGTSISGATVALLGPYPSILNTAGTRLLGSQPSALTVVLWAALMSSYPRCRKSIATFAQSATEGRTHAVPFRTVCTAAFAPRSSFEGPFLAVQGERSPVSWWAVLSLENKVNLAAVASAARLLPLISAPGAVSVRTAALV